MPDELLLLNGAIYTGRAELPHARALAARDGRILYVGSDAAARSALPDAAAIDLRGRCVLPGLTDAHLHLGAFGMALVQVNTETPTLAEALERVAERARALPPGRWITGRGWNHNLWGGAFPTAADLDGVAPEHPVYLSTKSGHAGWANSLALRLAGITAETPDPPSGQIVRDAHGAPTGILLEGAMDLVTRAVPEPSDDDRLAAIRRAGAAAARAGLTGVHDMDGLLFFPAEQILRERDELAVRIVKSVPREALDQAVALGLRSGFGDGLLRLGPVKMFADGALGPRTAWMLAPYATAPQGAGLPALPAKVLEAAVRGASAAGLGCAIHAIGDRACRTVLDVYERVPSPSPAPAARRRIEHLQILHPDDLLRVARLGVIASMQPIHATSDMDISDRHLGPRAERAYVFRSLLMAGVPLAFGSDCPVEPIDPLYGIHAAVTRRRPDGSPGRDGWHPEQRLTVEEAIRAYTWGPAYAAGREGCLGTLAAGFLADLTILDADVTRIPPMEIRDVPVAGTVLGGRFTWRSDGL